MTQYKDDWQYEEPTCHSVGIAGRCGFMCPVLLYGTCPEREDMLNGLKSDTIGNIIRYAIENRNNPAEALVDYYEEKGSAVPISYSKAVDIVEGRK